MRLTLQESDYPLPHAHVHVRLSGLEVVVQVLAEAGQQRYRLLLPPPVHVLREDNFSRFHKTHTNEKPCASFSVSVSFSFSGSVSIQFLVFGFSVSGFGVDFAFSFDFEFGKR